MGHGSRRRFTSWGGLRSCGPRRTETAIRQGQFPIPWLKLMGRMRMGLRTSFSLRHLLAPCTVRLAQGADPGAFRRMLQLGRAQPVFFGNRIHCLLRFGPVCLQFSVFAKGFGAVVSAHLMPTLAPWHVFIPWHASMTKSDWFLCPCASCPP